jgi:hypothetical protein
MELTWSIVAGLVSLVLNYGILVGTTRTSLANFRRELDLHSDMLRREMDQRMQANTGHVESVDRRIEHRITELKDDMVRELGEVRNRQHAMGTSLTKIMGKLESIQPRQWTGDDRREHSEE